MGGNSLRFVVGRGEGGGVSYFVCSRGGVRHISSRLLGRVSKAGRVFA